MLGRLKVLSIGAVALLTACDLAPPYIRPVGEVPATLPHGGIYPDAPTDAEDVSAIGWRDFFIDDRLRQIIAMGLENDRDLKIAAANVLAARALYRVQRSEQLPTINASASADFAHSKGQTTNSYEVDAGFAAFEIDLFGRIKNLSKAALERYFATDQAQRAARVALIAEIANAWLTLGADQDQLRISRNNLQSLEQSLSLTQSRFKIGVASELEARQADADYQAGKDDIAVLETQTEKDRNALSLLVGSSIAPALLPTGLPNNGATLGTLPSGISSEVLLRRPDVLQAEHELIAQNADIGAARAALFPSISLTGLLGTMSGGLSDLFTRGSFTRALEPTLSYNIFDGGRARANVKLTEANRQAAAASYEKTVQIAFREVADALAERGKIAERMDAQTRRTESAEVAARLSDARFRVGVTSFLDALVSQRTAYAAHQELITTQLRRSLNLVELYRSLGGGLS